MDSINQRTVTPRSGGYDVVREVEANELVGIVTGVRASKGQLDTIQSILGSLSTPSATWEGYTSAQQLEKVRQATVVLSEIVEQQLKLLIFLAGKEPN